MGRADAEECECEEPPPVWSASPEEAEGADSNAADDAAGDGGAEGRRGLAPGFE